MDANGRRDSFGQRYDELAVNSNWSAFPVLTMNNYFFAGVASTDRDFREAVGDATNSGVGATTAEVLSARMTGRFSRTLTNAVPWS